MTSPESKKTLETALEGLLAASGEPETPVCLYQLYYEQGVSDGPLVPAADAVRKEFYFPSPSLNLAFKDEDLDAVKTAWKLVMGDEANEDDYMVFDDREGADADDEVYE
jgi:Rab proteins geranylgeranyltransferase component A